MIAKSSSAKPTLFYLNMNRKCSYVADHNVLFKNPRAVLKAITQHMHSTCSLLHFPHWVMCCKYIDESNAMDTLPDFLIPGNRMVFLNTNFKICKTLPTDTEGGMFVACCCHWDYQVELFKNQMGNWGEMEVKVLKGESMKVDACISS